MNLPMANKNIKFQLENTKKLTILYGNNLGKYTNSLNLLVYSRLF